MALSPLVLAAKGCDNAGIIGDNCPTAEDCPSGAAGKGGTSGSEPVDCGGLLGVSCRKGEYCDFSPDAACGAGDRTGTCKPQPEACDLVYLPVCGCDGKTYGNACSAQAAGVSVAREGTCAGGGVGETCGGLAGQRCDEGLYCYFPVETQCGSGDQTGMCTPIALGCTKELAPVCGCDAVTYGNPCMAAAAGVSIAHQGSCDAEGTECGEVGDCAPDEFCNFPPSSSCGRADGPGVCTKRAPKDSPCDASYAPVCGCDGKTYGNACSALVASVSVASTGACAGEACGGLAGTKCSDGYFCDYPLEAQCGSGDRTGTCEPLAEVCTDEVDPVCGCDGKSYANSCYANRNGVAVAARGECSR